MQLVPDRDTIEGRFMLFHLHNPGVYQRLVQMARDWKANGRTRGSINMFFEVLRYERGLVTKGDDFKVNNNFRSRYARMIMQDEPGLRGFFDTRELQSE